MKYIILVVKHHDGFCLWPSSQTDYTVARSQYNRDIVGALANSAQKFGLKLGLYYSLWDQHMDQHISDEWGYIDFIMLQLEELLTGYGPLVELWFDGFWRRQQSGWTKLSDEVENRDISLEERFQRDADFIDAWRMEGAYRWQMDHMYHYIKSLQPDCLVLNNSTGSYPGVPLFPVDARTGERYTDIEGDKKLWNWMGKDTYIPLQIETTMSTKGNQRFPEGNWFWHDWDHSALSVEEIWDYQAIAEKMQANLVLNVGPDPNGELRPEDVKVLTDIKK
jgi:alpha-L-fucosidase